MWRSELPRKPNITCSPREYFTDEYGRTWRFADRSGSKDPLNVDVFRGALGSIVQTYSGDYRRSWTRSGLAALEQYDIV